MKRLVDTNQFRDPWFRKLSLKAKALFWWLCANCDNAGVIDLDLESASFDIGEPIDKKNLAELASRLELLPSGKIWIKKFIPFQWGQIKLTSKIHCSVVQLLKSHYLRESLTHEHGIAMGYLSHINAIEVGCESHQVQDKDKEQVQQEGVRGRFQKPSLEAVKLNGAKIGLPDCECEKFWHYHESKGWKVGNSPMKSWPSAMITWRSNWQERPNQYQKPEPESLAVRELRAMRRQLEREDTT